MNHRSATPAARESAHPEHNHCHIGSVALFEVRRASPTGPPFAPGQDLDLTGVPSRDDYYFVSTANPDGIFTEITEANNTAWVKFNGNRKIEVIDHSPCDTPGLCGERSTNR